MNLRGKYALLTGSFVALCASVGSIPANAETFVGSSVESRLLLAYDVPDAALEPFLPEGWSSVPFPNGPLAGADCILTWIERELERDAEGKPSATPQNMAVTLIGLASDGAAPRLLVYRVYTTVKGEGPYGNAVTAEMARTQSLATTADGTRHKADQWTLTRPDAGSVTLSLDVTLGMSNWNTGEARPFSNKDTDFSRIYRFDRLIELLSSAPLSKPLDGTLTLEVTLDELAPLFDGSETFIAAMNVPIYVREIFLP